MLFLAIPITQGNYPSALIHRGRSSDLNLTDVQVTEMNGIRQDNFVLTTKKRVIAIQFLVHCMLGNYFLNNKLFRFGRLQYSALDIIGRVKQ
jgi:hypothetical protein